MIYTNGCSYTKPFNDRTPNWSYHLADLLKTDVTYAGRPGKSNNSIIRETIKDFIELKNKSIDVSHVIISLTFENRFDVHYNDQFLSVTPGFPITGVDDKTRNFIKYKFLTHNTKCNIIDLFSSIVTLKFFIEQNNSKFFVFWAADETDVVKANLDSIKIYVDFLTENSFDLLNFSFCKFAYKNQYHSIETKQVGIHAHPPVAAHIKLAEMLYDRLK